MDNPNSKQAPTESRAPMAFAPITRAEWASWQAAMKPAQDQETGNIASMDMDRSLSFGNPRTTGRTDTSEQTPDSHALVTPRTYSRPADSKVPSETREPDPAVEAILRILSREPRSLTPIAEQRAKQVQSVEESAKQQRPPLTEAFVGEDGSIEFKDKPQEAPRPASNSEDIIERNRLDQSAKAVEPKRIDDLVEKYGKDLSPGDQQTMRNALLYTAAGTFALLSGMLGDSAPNSLNSSVEVPFIKALHSQGYAVAINRYVELREHGAYTAQMVITPPNSTEGVEVRYHRPAYSTREIFDTYAVTAPPRNGQEIQRTFNGGNDLEVKRRTNAPDAIERAEQQFRTLRLLRY